MNAVVPFRTNAVSATDDPKMLSLIRRTVAKDCNDEEFNLFVHTARHLRLDPLRRQIYAFVYSKNDLKKRKMSIITGIDGFRTIADRTGNYRPDEDEPTFEVDDALKSEHNPVGLMKATVRVYKHSHGSWHKVTAGAHWQEYAPLTEGWSEVTRVDSGRQWPDGNTKWDERPAPGAVKVTKLDTSGQWGKMPRLMLAKVAEALALRKAWPDDLGNVYAAEEMDRARALDDMLPSEAAATGDAEERLERIGGTNAILIAWTPDGALEPVPVGKLADRALDFIDKHKDEPSILALWGERNRHGLREFWARAPGDSLAVKKQLEAAQARAGAE